MFFIQRIYSMVHQLYSYGFPILYYFITNALTNMDVSNFHTSLANGNMQSYSREIQKNKNIEIMLREKFKA